VTDPASGEELVVTYGNPPTAQPQQREVDSGRRRKPPAPEDEGEEEALPRLQINPFTEGEQEIFLQPPEPS
jgi:hypothetical protein